jgi:lipoyl(octanoyl) transferase
MRDRELWLVRAGTVPYRRAWAWQRALVERRAAGDICDTVLLLEHPHVYTIGKRGSDTDVLADAAWLTANGAEVVRSDRGGQVTYHGPGQLVGYPILDLTRRGRDLHRYLRFLEDFLVELCRQLEVESFTVAGRTGVWTGQGKLASIGVGVRHWVSMHGFCLNVSADTSPFDRINPCGMKSCRITSLARERGGEPPMQHVKELVRTRFEELLEATLPCS